MDAWLALPAATRSFAVSSPKPPAPQAESAPTAEAIPLADLLRREQEAPAAPAPSEPVREVGGRRDGPEPTRYGDWEKNGRCIDF